MMMITGARAHVTIRLVFWSVHGILGIRWNRKATMRQPVSFNTHGWHPYYTQEGRAGLTLRTCTIRTLVFESLPVCEWLVLRTRNGDWLE